MPHIALPPDLPGILGILAFRPDTGKLLIDLTDLLLRGPGPLTVGERELIAAYVSGQNSCSFCRNAHGAVAARLLDGGEGVVCSVQQDFTSAAIPEKLKALLALAGKVQAGGASVTAEDVESARRLGATDLEIHDTVLIAAAYCMFNRYVDGLGTVAPTEPGAYQGFAAQLVEFGYARSVAAAIQSSASNRA